MGMQRILAIGSSGDGRSTLARRLSRLEQQLAHGREAA